MQKNSLDALSRHIKHSSCEYICLQTKNSAAGVDICPKDNGDKALPLPNNEKIPQLIRRIGSESTTHHFYVRYLKSDGRSDYV